MTGPCSFCGTPLVDAAASPCRHCRQRGSMILFIDCKAGRVVTLTPEEWEALKDGAEFVVDDDIRLYSEVQALDNADLPKALREAGDAVQAVMDLESACRKLLGLEPRTS